MTTRQPLEVLAALLGAIEAAAQAPAKLDGLLCLLADASGGLFSSAVLFKGGYGGRSFLIAARRRCDSQQAREWMRWPLRRLFVRMKPLLIVDPFAIGLPGLAIPFAYDEERYIVLAPLSAPAFAEDHREFFSALESITIPRYVGNAESEAPPTPIDPTIVAFAVCDELYERTARVLGQRGWPLARVLTFGDLWPRLKRTASDILVVDTDELPDPVGNLSSIHRVADNGALRVVAFTGTHGAIPDTAPFVDSFLPHDAPQTTIFKVFKTLARDGVSFKRARVEENSARLHRAATAMLTPAELVEFAAAQAAEIIRGWAHVVLLNEFGAAFRDERPRSSEPVLTAMPKTILQDAPLFELSAGESFFEEVSDRGVDRMALRSLAPLSGVSIPIVNPAGRCTGAIVALSREQWADSEIFNNLDSLARVLGRRFDELQPSRRVVPEFRHEPLWERLREHGLGLDVYRSDCAVPWRYRAVGEDSGIFTIGLSDDSAFRSIGASGVCSARALARELSNQRLPNACFAGAIDFTLQSLTYATRGFSPPVALGATGPRATIAIHGDMLSGVTNLESASSALVCNQSIWRWLNERPRGFLSVSEMLEREMPPGLASIVTLGSPLH